MMTNSILVVDDDPLLRDVMLTVLHDEGYAASAARDGQEALDLVARARPGLVLLDLRMPGLDGWAFVEELQRRGLQVPFVICSAGLAAEVYAKQLGAAGHLDKPFNVAQLLSTVDQFFLPRAA